jgi:hypothetical protein
MLDEGEDVGLPALHPEARGEVVQERVVCGRDYGRADDSGVGVAAGAQAVAEVQEED